MEKITLTELLSSVFIPCTDSRIIQGISDDSRLIKQDWLFICRDGIQDKGNRYVKDVLKKGGVVLWEEDTKENCYHVDCIKSVLPEILILYYHNPCTQLCVIGVTGTNGKTSVTLILQQLLTYLNKKTMVIGTNHIRYLEQDVFINNTTPSACTLAYYFAKAVECEIPYLIMEVSSHAIDQERISFIRFDYVLYTNIDKDHLDYHITRTQYMYTKFKLRKYLKCYGVIVLNHDLTSLHPLYHLSDYKIITFGCTQAHLQISDVKYEMTSASFSFEGSFFQMKLIGMMNIYNVVEALVVLQRMRVPIRDCQLAVSSLGSIAGRMEVITIKGAVVWLDYAHTDSALKALLELANQVKQARVICVVGCGGNRDTSKRPLMAKVALQNSDITIFTADNPRYEEVHDILFDMIRGNSGIYDICENRACAIKYAMKIVQNRDIIIIAGKGDETTQSIHGVNYQQQDRELIKQYGKMEE